MAGRGSRCPGGDGPGLGQREEGPAVAGCAWGPGRSAAGAGSPGLQPALSAGGNRPATNAEEKINRGWRRDERKQPSKEHALLFFFY